MVKGLLSMSVHGLFVCGAVALALWASSAGAAVRYDTATPHTPPASRYKYIPLHGSSDSYKGAESVTNDVEDTSNSGMPTSELILTVFRTALDVIRNINKNRAVAALPSPKINKNRAVADLPSPKINSTGVQLRRGDSKNDTVGSGRGFEDYYDEHHYHETTTTEKPVKQGRYTDPWAGYYDWIINEGSFKFWSVFQLFTAALLLYACLSAIYYAKFNPILPDYSMEYDDYFLERSVGRKARSVEASEMPSGLSWITPSTFQFILDAISKHYEQ